MAVYRRHDETSRNEAVKHVARRIPGARIEDFDTAHTLKLESPSEFKKWSEAYLNRFVQGGTHICNH